jgi:hypothetical protein
MGNQVLTVAWKKDDSSIDIEIKKKLYQLAKQNNIPITDGKNGKHFGQDYEHCTFGRLLVFFSSTQKFINLCEFKRKCEDLLYHHKRKFVTQVEG